MEDIASRDLWRSVSAEFVAMFLFVFVSVGCALSTTGTVTGAASLSTVTATAGGASSTCGGPLLTSSLGAAGLTISLTFGLMIFVLIHCFGHISGAHINPAVTMSLVVAQQVTPLKGVLYVCAQCFGSIAASGILMELMGLDADTMGGYNLLSGPDNLKVGRGFCLELILTFLLVFTVFATIDPSRATTEQSGPLAIGLAVAVAHFIAVPITGCGINPARSLGPALFTSKKEASEDLWVFIVAPLLGGIIVAILYPFWFAKENFAGGLQVKFYKAKVEPASQPAGATLPATPKLPALPPPPPKAREFSAQQELV